MSFVKKFLLCFILSFILPSTILLLGTDVKTLIDPRIIFIFAGLVFIVPYIILPVWEYRERKHLPGGQSIFNFLDAAVVYLTAFCIAIFGWKKIFHLQFRTPLSISDLAMSDQSGETLTWFYFGWSPAFGYIIALIQLSGAALLLFRKTRLAGLFLLLPVMLNIALINVFYQMNMGALLQSVVLTITLVYLLLQYWPWLISILLIARDNIVPGNNKIQLIAAGFTFLFAFLFIYLDNRSMPQESSLYGRYETTALSVNGKKMQATSPGNCDTTLTRVYFDMNNVCVLEYNNPGHRLIANYRFNEANKILESTLKDAGKEILLHAAVSFKGNRQIELQGTLGGDSLKLLLLKTK